MSQHSQSQLISPLFTGRTDAKAETPILLPPHEKSWLIGKDWCWEGLGAGGERDDRGWDGWMASLTRWTWVWVNSESWWWTGRPGVLQLMGSQSQTRLSDWTELDWTEGLESPWCFSCPLLTKLVVIKKSHGVFHIGYFSFLFTYRTLNAISIHDHLMTQYPLTDTWEKALKPHSMQFYHNLYIKVLQKF